MKPVTRRQAAVSAFLQWHLNVDPDTARYYADRILHHADRAGLRESTSGLPSPGEVTRAVDALARRQIKVNRDDGYAALFAALTLGEYEEAMS